MTQFYINQTEIVLSIPAEILTSVFQRTHQSSAITGQQKTKQFTDGQMEGQTYDRE